ncbi:MAG: phytanoyl-CoA dioxygenase family protein [Pseudomonas sp.]|uniref:phytanoyl-CoA dioxygenase family protein n=1 Tax=Pseudomonas sp. TaxID=306 RepID=UPI0033980D20
MPLPPLAASSDTGLLGACQLKRLWSRAQRQCQGVREAPDPLDPLVLHALGIGLEQGLGYLYGSQPDFATFERWILTTAGPPSSGQLARLNALALGQPLPAATRQWLTQIEAMADVLGPADLQHWHERGYLILHHAVPEAQREAAVEAVLQASGARLDDPGSWYRPRPQGVMVPLIQHPALQANRESRRIHKAFAQLWGSSDLWHSVDRVGFHPPAPASSQRPPLHWDVDLVPPIPFGTQALLYLTDTPAEQGALTLVPGFHRRLDAWLHSLPPDTDPGQCDLQALGSRPIAGAAGDLVIWHQALPHGPGPNLGQHPRLVQYLNLAPAPAAALPQC